MTRPRATSSAVDELGAVIADIKARIVRVEQQSHLHNQPVSALSPPGTIVDYIGTTAPAGWALLDGTTIVGAQFTYPDLWAVLPSSFKSGSNLVLPDTRGRVSVGLNSADSDFDAIGDSGGAKTHTLTIPEMPSHTHTQNPHGHIVIIEGVGQAWQQTGFAGAGYTFNVQGVNDGLRRFLAADTTATNQNTGGGGAHNNLQPYITFAKMMKLV